MMDEMVESEIGTIEYNLTGLHVIFTDEADDHVGDGAATGNVENIVNSADKVDASAEKEIDAGFNIKAITHSHVLDVRSDKPLVKILKDLNVTHIVSPCMTRTEFYGFYPRLVYDIKQGGKGKITRYKTILVLNGYSQNEDSDIHEVSAPVSRYVTVWKVKGNIL